MPDLPEVHATPDAIADALSAHGACRIRGLPSPPLAAALRGELEALCAAGALRPAGVGRTDGHALRPDVRGDATLWLDDARCGAPARAYLDLLDTLRLALNQRLYLGLQEVEAHYAAYPAGAGYARHRDRFRDHDARVVSLVTYLNPGWQAADGGLLRLHVGASPIDVLPAQDSVCFLSELEHEVLPAGRERFSIAAWMRRAAR